MKYSMTGQEKYDLLIQVTAWAGLTVYDDLWIHKTTAWNENDKMISVSFGHKRKLFDSQVLTELSWLVIIYSTNEFETDWVFI
jgi:hypothetical protein